MNRRNPKNSKKLNRGSSSPAPLPPSPPRIELPEHLKAPLPPSPPRIELPEHLTAPLPPSPPWIELPEHLTADILQRLYTEEIIDSAQYVCTTWWRVCNDPDTWRSIDLDYRRPAARDFGNICRCRSFNHNKKIRRCKGRKQDHICRCWVNKFEYLVRRAVDLSQGQLLQLKISVWTWIHLLDYAADRSCQLRCLTVLVCDNYGATAEDLILVIIKLPQLEELHLMMNPMLVSNEFETIGIACPMLKLFSYHNCLSKDSNFSKGLDFSEHVEAIGKTMPNLLHLRLYEHRMGYEGLEAILDGCPHLRSLDLRPCSVLDKVNKVTCSDSDSDSDSGQRRTAQQKKDLWLHTDSISLKDWIMKRKDNYDYRPENAYRSYCCDDIRGEYY